MITQTERVLRGLFAYRGWVWEIATAFACFALLVFLCRRATGKYRYLQRRLPAVILWASAAVALVWLAWERDIVGNLSAGLGLSWKIPSLFWNAGNALYKRAVSLPVNAGLVLFMLAYFMFKSAWIFVRRLRQKKGAATFRKDWVDAYEYNKEVSGYVLRREYIQVRAFYQRLFLAEGLIFGIARCAVERIAGFEPFFVMSVALSLYTWECFDYYSGRTLEECRGSETKGKDCREVARELLSLLRDTVNPIAAEAVEYSDMEEALESSAEHRIMEIQCSEDYKKRCMGYEWRQTLDGAVHTELIEAALLLAERKSIYIPHSFYRDLTPYLFPFLRLEFLEGKKLLVIAGVQDEEEIRSWMSAGFSKRCCVPLFWLSGRGREPDRADIGIISSAYMEDAIEAYDRCGFFRQVSAVLLLDPSCLALAPIKAAQLFARLPIGEERPVYIACGRNGMGMVDWLSRLCRAEFIQMPVVGKAEGSYHVVVDLDSGQNGREWETASLVCRAAGSVPWYGKSLTPVYDGTARIKEWQGERALQFLADGSGSDAENAFCIAEDSMYHVSEAFFQHRIRGRSVNFMAVLSPHYMLREFMLSGAGEKGLYELLPEHVCSERNLAIAVGHSLLKGGMEWKELDRLCEYYGIDRQKGKAWLLGRLNSVYTEMLGLDKMWIAEDLAAQGERERKVVISAEAGRRQFARWYQKNIEPAIYAREETDKRELPEPIAGGHIFQYHLPEQFMLLGGKYYRIGEILLKEGRETVRLTRTADSFKRRYYRQVRRIDMKEESSFPAECMQRYGKSCVELHRARLSVQTEEELCCAKFYDVRNAEHRRISSVPERVYRGKAYLKISAEGQDCIWAGILLRECLPTLFPRHWQLLSVAVSDRQMQGEYKGYLDSISGDAIDGRAIYIIEDSPVDMGLLEAIGHRFEALMTLLNEYVDWGNREGKAEIMEYFGEELLGRRSLISVG